MKNLRNIFKEYNDPKVYRNLKIGFACLIIIGILITFVVSPDLRHKIGIGNNQPVSTPKVHHPKAHHSHHDLMRHHHPLRQAHNPAKGALHTSKGHTHSDEDKGLGGVKSPPSHPHESEPESGINNPGPETPSPESSPPSSPPSSHPSEGDKGSQGTNPENVNPESKPKNSGGVKIEIPTLEVPPVVEEVTHGVNETVNGVTGKVEDITKPLPVHAEVPEICLLKC